MKKRKRQMMRVLVFPYSLNKGDDNDKNDKSGKIE